MKTSAIATTPKSVGANRRARMTVETRTSALPAKYERACQLTPPMAERANPQPRPSPTRGEGGRARDDGVFLVRAWIGLSQIPIFQLRCMNVNTNVSRTWSDLAMVQLMARLLTVSTM